MREGSRGWCGGLLAAASVSSRERERQGMRERGKRGRKEKENGRKVTETVAGGGASGDRPAAGRPALGGGELRKMDSSTLLLI